MKHDYYDNEKAWYSTFALVKVEKMTLAKRTKYAIL